MLNIEIPDNDSGDTISRGAQRLQIEFPYIEPKSRLGVMGVALFDAAFQASEGSQEPLERLVTEQQADIFGTIAKHLYVKRKAANSNERQPGTIAYQAYIASACAIPRLAARQKTYFTPEQQTTFANLISEVGLLFWIEDCHFQPPKQS